MSYYVRGDVVDEFGGKPSPLAKAPVKTLADARKTYQRMVRELGRVGFRIDHACIVGPQGEVYSVEE